MAKAKRDPKSTRAAAERALSRKAFMVSGAGRAGLAFEGGHFGNGASFVLEFVRTPDGVERRQLECAVGDDDEYDRYGYTWATTDTRLDDLDAKRLRHARADIVALLSPDGDVSWGETAAFVDRAFDALKAVVDQGVARAA